MCNQVRLHAAVGELHQVESRSARGKRKVRHADKVSVGDAVVMPLQSVKRTPQQTGSYLAIDSFCPSESEPSSCKPGSKAGKSEPDPEATGNCQDIELQRRKACT